MSRVYRCFTEKRKNFNVEAQGIYNDLRDNLGIKRLSEIRILNRYDVEGISEDVYREARNSVFSEPQVDDCYDETLPQISENHWILGVEALPGQFDQRADSCAQCIQMLTCMDRPAVQTARIYIFYGELNEEEKLRLRNYLINPVEAREAALTKPETLAQVFPVPSTVAVLSGFISASDARLNEILVEHSLAMDVDDLKYMQDYFRDTEMRDPTVTELKLVDTYWSDHCRHTTFGTHIDSVTIHDPEVQKAYDLYLAARREVYGENAEKRPQTLMDIATLAAKVLAGRGLLNNLDISEEINACSIHIDVEVAGKTEDWLLMFKNETHNHPTEIEPFGGAATCIGGAIRDPLSGRSYVYQAMRVTGAGDPRVPMEDTKPGKLPQRKLTVTAAQGYSSYGNQIGLATGLVHEIYHPGYVAKRMEIGAVVGAVPATNVVREIPAPGDQVILVGGRTGRDGIGGATGSSKTHNMDSLVKMASEVQKGNAPEERKIQRLFRNPDVTKMIKRCNDFGAGGVSVAIGELADGLDIDLSKVRKKYEGLNGTEIAISESQERMAVVVAPENVDAFIKKATDENLEAYVVAGVTEEPRMIMRLDGEITANLSRAFLSSNGATKHSEVVIPNLLQNVEQILTGSPIQKLHALVSDLRFCSQRGLGERFDGSIGAGSVIMPYGGMTQLTPSQSMAALMPVLTGETNTCSVMSFGFDPNLSLVNPFEGAKTAVVTSVAKLVAAGADPDLAYLTLQEYFERLRQEPIRWGKPFSALLGALQAQIDLGIAAIGGKDSMSGSFLDMDVPPTLVSFAIAPAEADKVISPEFKTPGNAVCLFLPGDTLPETKKIWRKLFSIIKTGTVKSAWALTDGGAAEGIFKMAIGNRLGFKAVENLDLNVLFKSFPGAILAEVTEQQGDALLLGHIIAEPEIVFGNEIASLTELQMKWENSLEKIFPTRTGSEEKIKQIHYSGRKQFVSTVKYAKPRAVITAFPGTNCEYDTARAIERAGGKAEIIVVKNLTSSLLEESVSAVRHAIQDSQMIVIPGGFSGGDEPDGSAKFIAAFFRNPEIKDAVHNLLQNRDGLMLGICNGFQALIKLGLVPYGEIRPMCEEYPTLTYNLIGRHQSRYVHTRISSLNSPWMNACRLGDIHTIPISHGEGRFVASKQVLSDLIASGQVATQYTDINGVPSMEISVNPNGSMEAIEGIFSPDGRVFGKMGHSERRGDMVAKNIYGNKIQPIFENGINYYL